MRSILFRAVDHYRREGLINTIAKIVMHLYDNLIRLHLPRSTVGYNGVCVRASRFGDSMISWQNTDLPEYEENLIKAIREHVSIGDTVSIVGGGWGFQPWSQRQTLGRMEGLLFLRLQ